MLSSPGRGFIGSCRILSARAARLSTYSSWPRLGGDTIVRPAVGAFQVEFVGPRTSAQRSNIARSSGRLRIRLARVAVRKPVESGVTSTVVS